jgi:hypothetical protein
MNPNTSTYSTFLYLPHCANYKNIIKTILTKQQPSMQDTCLPTSTARIESLQVVENSGYPVPPELDDEPCTNAAHILPLQLITCPCLFTLTLPIFINAAYGLRLLDNKQTKRTPPISEPMIPEIIV